MNSIRKKQILIDLVGVKYADIRWGARRATLNSMIFEQRGFPPRIDCFDALQ